ncbi:MAG: ComEC/Rec2 family competence protein [Clostridia bacterium]|nr:ComEC/Rec2 family competence protein [Clostridia bacterium]
MAAVVKKKLKKAIIVLVFSALICGSLIFNFEDISRLNKLCNRVITEDFVIEKEPVNYGENYVAKAICMSDNVFKKGDKICLNYDDGDIAVGDKVRVSLTVKPINNSRYRISYYSEGIYVKGSVRNFSSVETDDSVLCFVPELRKSIKNILLNYLSYENQAFVSALTIGDRSDLSSDFNDRVKASGTSHIIVVSGMHLVILIGGFISFLKRIIYNKYAFFFISLVCVFGFAAVCGFTMSVIRAGITYLLFAAAPLFNRESDPLNALGATVVIVMLFSPFAIFSISFQLSVMSTFGILTLAPFLTNQIYYGMRLGGKLSFKLVQVASVTLAATIMTAFLTVYYFGYLSLVAILANIFVTFAVTVVLTLSVIGVATVFVTGFSVFSEILFNAVSLLTDYIAYVISLTGNFKFSAIPMPKMFALVFGASAVFLLLLKAINKRIKEKREIN